jgi:hypothetical protein
VRHDFINTKKNNVGNAVTFLVQQCTDISIVFDSTSTIKCIQLFPAQFDLIFDYSVENYIIEKTVQCYNIVSYNSSSTVLFSNGEKP